MTPGELVNWAGAVMACTLAGIMIGAAVALFVAAILDLKKVLTRSK